MTSQRPRKPLSSTPATASLQRETVMDPDLINLYKPLSAIYIGGPATHNNGAQAITSKSKAKTQDMPNRASTSQTTVTADIASVTM